MNCFQLSSKGTLWTATHLRIRYELQRLNYNSVGVQSTHLNTLVDTGTKAFRHEFLEDVQI